jgi:TolB-like protein
MPSNLTARKFSFEEFDLDIAGYKLLRNGKHVSLERRPMDLLILLAERRGQLVSRTEIAERLWGKDVFVDVENGINTAIRKVRQALRDPADSPRFIETVPGRGYRFIAPFAAPRPKPQKAQQTAAGAEQRVMLAVLPFENLSGSPDQEYFSDGLTEETISCLGRISPERMGVIARTTSMAYKASRKSVRAIGNELGVDYVLESSVRHEGNHIRITAQLIRVKDQTHVWAETYDRELTGVLDVQRELSTAIVRSVRLRLSPQRLAALEQPKMPSPEAYDYYLRGRHFWNRLSPVATRRAIEFYRRATELDPGYALAWSGLADAYATGPISGDARPLEVWPLAREAAARAIKAAPDLAETQTSLGFLKFWLDWDWPAAEGAFRRAIALNPSYALAHRMLGICLSHMDLKARKEALQAAQRARELDPLNVTYQALSSQIAFAAGDHAAAEEHARRAIELDPEFWIGYMQFGQVLEQLGEAERAIEALETAARFSSGNSKPVSLRGYILAKTGRRKEAQEIMKALETASRERYVPPYAFALIYAGLGETDLALEWLERVVKAHDVHAVFLTNDPKWDFLRHNRRFAQVLNRCAFATHRTG